MNAVGKAGLWTLMVAAVGVWFWLAPADPVPAVFTATADDSTTLVRTALSDYDANDSLADSAPQQQVTNGWVARDLLTIVAYQNVDLLDALSALGEQGEQSSTAPVPDDRVPALLVIAVAAMCWLGINQPKPTPVQVAS